MARTTPGFLTHEILPENPFTFFVVLTSVLSVFSLVIFLCGSHRGFMDSLRGKDSKTTVILGDNDQRMVKKMKNRLSSKALLMVSWRKSRDEEEEFHGYNEEENGDGGVIWKKTIIKGDKCRPLDFSGKILYDADGNLLKD